MDPDADTLIKKQLLLDTWMTGKQESILTETQTEDKWKLAVHTHSHNEDESGNTRKQQQQLKLIRDTEIREAKLNQEPKRLKKATTKVQWHRHTKHEVKAEKQESENELQL